MRLDLLSSAGSPDAADGDKAFLRSVCDALRGRGLVSAHHDSRAHRVQAGDPESQGASLQILAAHEPGTVFALLIRTQPHKRDR